MVAFEFKRYRAVTLVGRLSRILAGLGVSLILLSCGGQPPSFDPMTAPSICNNDPLKPLGRRSVIPTTTPAAQFASLTGTVVQSETDDAIDGAILILTPVGQNEPERRRWVQTNSTGGFVFDSISPGSYRLWARRIGYYQDTSTVSFVSGRVDTVRLRMRTARCGLVAPLAVTPGDGT